MVLFSIQIIHKSTDKYKTLKTIGSISYESEIEYLIERGKCWIKEHIAKMQIDFKNAKTLAEEFQNNIE